MKITPLEIEEVESKAGNIYEAVVVSAKRARQINDEEKLEYNTRVEPLIKIEDESDDTVISKDKMNISIEFEVKPKTTESALNELLNDQLDFRVRNENIED